MQWIRDQRPSHKVTFQKQSLYQIILLTLILYLEWIIHSRKELTLQRLAIIKVKEQAVDLTMKEVVEEEAVVVV